MNLQISTGFKLVSHGRAIFIIPYIDNLIKLLPTYRQIVLSFIFLVKKIKIVDKSVILFGNIKIIIE